MTDNYKTIIKLAEDVRGQLESLGLSKELSDDIHRRIVFAAGSILPPVSGAITVDLGNLRKL